MSLDYIDSRQKIPDYILASVEPGGEVKTGLTGDKGKMLSLALNIAWCGERVADSLMTNHAIKNHGATELNPLSKPFVNMGIPGMLALNAGLTAGSYGLSSLLNSHVSPLAGVIFPLLGCLTHAVVLARNAKYMKDRGW